MKNLFKVKPKREVKGEGVVTECRLTGTDKQALRIVRTFDVYIQIVDSSKTSMARVQTYENRLNVRLGAVGGLGLFGKIVNTATTVAGAAKTVKSNIDSLKNGPAEILARPFNSGDKISIFYDSKKPKKCMVNFSPELLNATKAADDAAKAAAAHTASARTEPG